LFNGQIWDSETRFYYYRNRCYDPQIGRFISRDPLGIWGDPTNLGNSYTYVGNNPWSYTDPYGLIKPQLGPGSTSKIGEDVFVFGDVVTRKTVYRGMDAVTAQQRYYDEMQRKNRENQETIAKIGQGVEIAAEINIPSPDDAIKVGGVILGVKGARKLTKCLTKTGLQKHHIVSSPIEKALNKHKILKGKFNREDPLYKFFAKDYESHHGWQEWHRDVDKEVEKWLKTHKKATEQEFKDTLNKIYSRPEIKDRIPNVNIR